MTEQPGRPRGLRTSAYPGTFDPIHIIRRVTLFDIGEDEHGGAVARLVGAAEPNEPEQDGPGGHAFSGSGPNEPGGGDPNEPESSDGSGLAPCGRASGEPDHD
jgi:hypothetical protein